jgi:hypothetical protein
MNVNLPHTEYDVTRKSKVKKFYESYKIYIFSTAIFLIIFISSVTYYSFHKEKKLNFIAENYITAKIYIEMDKKNNAKDILKTIIFRNDSTYSTLALFLILNENLIIDNKEVLNLFNHILENNKFESEIKNLIIFKKALFESNFANESEMVNSIKPLINSETVWKPHALLLIGDYFAYKNEYLKAEEFYREILSTESLKKEFYNLAVNRLQLISND